MKKRKTLANIGFTWSVVSLLFVGCLSDNQSEPCDENTQILVEPPISDHELRMYPRATDSLARHIITLPEQTDDEADYKIEIYVGKMMEVDCNEHWLTGDFVEKVVDGWGYDYYKFNTEGQIMSTLIGCPGVRRNEFVHGKRELVRYNSRLPIVVYAPKEYTLRYKLWIRNTHEYTANEG